jgi:hypothetical protein
LIPNWSLCFGHIIAADKPKKVLINRNCCPITTNCIFGSTCYSEKIAEVKDTSPILGLPTIEFILVFESIKYFEIYPFGLAKTLHHQTKIYLLSLMRVPKSLLFFDLSFAILAISQHLYFIDCIRQGIF